MSVEKIHLIGARTRDLQACSIVPQPTTLLCSPEGLKTARISLLERGRVVKQFYVCLVVSDGVAMVLIERWGAACL
jgi:hypothetical protein